MATTQPSTMADNTAESRLQRASATLQRVQIELSNAVLGRQSIETQLNETSAVKKVFSTLTPQNEIYKLVGPALLKQDQTEARANVEKRLEFIRSEIQRVEAQIKKANEEAEKARTQIMEIQTAARTPSPGSGAGKGKGVGVTAPS